jgi:hypothetical protein
MNFLDGHLYPENQQPLIITAAPYAPGWIPSDFPEDIPITMEEQIQQLVRIAGEFGRPIATAQQAREICKIGVFYDTVEETLQANGFAPNRNGGNQGFLRKPD